MHVTLKTYALCTVIVNSYNEKNATPFIFLIFSSHSSRFWHIFSHRSSQDIPSCLLYDNLADRSEHVPWTAGKTLLNRALRIL